jgi:hypothetical protein
VDGAPQSRGRDMRSTRSAPPQASDKGFRHRDGHQVPEGDAEREPCLHRVKRLEAEGVITGYDDRRIVE